MPSRQVCGDRFLKASSLAIITISFVSSRRNGASQSAHSKPIDQVELLKSSQRKCHYQHSCSYRNAMVSPMKTIRNAIMRSHSVTRRAGLISQLMRRSTRETRSILSPRMTLPLNAVMKSIVCHNPNLTAFLMNRREVTLKTKSKISRSSRTNCRSPSLLLLKTIRKRRVGTK